VLLGCFIWACLPQSIHSAAFLSEAERCALLKAMSKHTSAEAPECLPASSAASSGSSSAADVAVDVEPADVAGKDAEALLLLRKAHSTDTTASADSAAHCAALQEPSSTSCPSIAGTVGGGIRGGSVGSCHSSRAGGSSAAPTASQMMKTLFAVAQNKVVLYAGSWRILHDIPGSGVLYWTPKIVQALLLASAASSLRPEAGSSSPGVAVVLLSAIPYAAASFVHLVNAWHSQRVGEAKLHISYTWLLGAVALLLLPFAASDALSGGNSSSTAAGIAAFALLTVAHVGVNGANGLQTGLVAGCLCPEQKALGLAMYNTIACLGAFLGPLLVGIIHDATQGYSVAMWTLGCSLAGAAFMVFRFKGNAIHRC